MKKVGPSIFDGEASQQNADL